MMMTFDELIERAMAEAGGQNALCRLVGGSHNIVPQWLSGQSLPSAVEQERVLAQLTGLTVETVHDIIWAERRRRWEAKWARMEARRNRPVMAADRRRPGPGRRRQAVASGTGGGGPLPGVATGPITSGKKSLKKRSARRDSVALRRPLAA